MKRVWMVMAVLCVAGTMAARAADDLAARRALAEELMTLTKVPENIEKSFAMVKKMLPKQMEQMSRMSGQTNMPPDAIAQTDKIMDVVASEMKWEKVKNDYIELYAGTLTESELKAAIAFYKTPEGQSFVGKQPELMKRAMELNQKVMMKVMPRIQELTREMKAAPAPAPVKE